MLAGTIYKALGTASIGSAAVTAAQAMQVQATPFGVRMPPRPVFNSQGQQVGTEEWPIGDVQVLSAQMTWNNNPDIMRGFGLNGTAQVSIQGPDGVFAQWTVDLDTSPPAVQPTPSPLGSLNVTPHDPRPPAPDTSP